MATQKALKLKEDARRQALQDQIDAILASQVLILERLHEVFAKLEALNLEEKTKMEGKAK